MVTPLGTLWERFAHPEELIDAYLTAAAPTQLTGTTGGPPTAPADSQAGEVAKDTSTDPVDALAARLAAGFGLASAVLLFFGVKEGELDRVIREAPLGAAALFTLVLAGVVIGAFVPALKATRPLRVGVPLGAGTVAAIVGFLCLDAMPGVDLHRGWLCGLAAMGALAIALTWSRVSDGKTGLLATGGVIFCVAIAFAVSVSLTGRTTLNRATVTASFGTGTERNTMTVNASAARLSSDKSFGITVLGMPFVKSSETTCAPSACELIHQVRIGANATGDATQTIKIDVPPGRYERILIQGAICSTDPRESDPDRGASTQSTTSTTSVPTTTSTALGTPERLFGSTPAPPNDASRDHCTDKPDLTSITLVTPPMESWTPTLTSQVSDARDALTLTAAASGLAKYDALCLRATVGNDVSEARQGPDHNWDASVTMRVDLPTLPTQVDVLAWETLAGLPCSTPTADVATQTLHIAKPAPLPRVT